MNVMQELEHLSTINAPFLAVCAEDTEGEEHVLAMHVLPEGAYAYRDLLSRVWPEATLGLRIYFRDAKEGGEHLSLALSKSAAAAKAEAESTHQFVPTIGFGLTPQGRSEANAWRREWGLPEKGKR